MIQLRKTKSFAVYYLILFLLLLPFDALADDFFEGAASIDALARSIQVTNPAKEPNINAKAAIVMDMDSGRILYEKNAHLKMAIASTTKIMTAILALENGKLDDMVTVSKRASDIWGSKIRLKAGDKYTLKDLLYGMMLNSGNDCAIAIAEYIGGTVENFAGMMNAKARVLGAKNTNFVCPHGLDTPEHYSTAYDLALITRYALKNKDFSTIVGTMEAEIPGKKLYNTNEMLKFYPGVDGVKTGYTGQAGRCLVTSATREGWRIISVVLGCPTRTARAQSSKNLLDYSFNNYKLYTLIKINEPVARLPVIKGVRKDVSILPLDEIHLPLMDEEVQGLETRINLPDRLLAPVYSGIEVGNIEYWVNGKLLAQTELKVSVDVRRKEFKDYFTQIAKAWLKLMRV